jgi:hypothetical protein
VQRWTFCPLRGCTEDVYRCDNATRLREEQIERCHANTSRGRLLHCLQQSGPTLLLCRMKAGTTCGPLTAGSVRRSVSNIPYIDCVVTKSPLRQSLGLSCVWGSMCCQTNQDLLRLEPRAGPFNAYPACGAHPQEARLLRM